MADVVKSAETKARNARHAEKEAKATMDATKEAEKKAVDKVKSTEYRAKSAEEWAQNAGRMPWMPRMLGGRWRRL